MTVYGNVPNNVFTTEGEMVRLISLDGANQWLDDLDGFDASSYFQECAIDATLTCRQYLGTKYSDVDMVNNIWVRRRATYIGAYLFSTRRGDPGIYEDHYRRCIAELQEAQEGLIQVPDLPLSSGALAVMQNVVVDMRFLYNKNRVRPSVSTDVAGNQPTTLWYPFDWL